MNDLEQQLTELGTQIDYRVAPVTIDDLIIRRNSAHAVPPRPRWRRGWFGVAVAVLTILVFVPSVLLRPSADEGSPASSTGPTVTQVSVAPTPPLLPASTIVTSDDTLLARIADGRVEAGGEWRGLVDAVVDQLIESPGPLGRTREERLAALYGCNPEAVTCQGGGGLRVTLAVDSAAQMAAQSTLTNWLAGNQSPVGAIVIVENGTGRIVAAASTGDDEQPWWLVPRTAGTLMQTITTVAALEAGIGLESVWDASSPMEFPLPDGNALTCSNRGEGGGETTLRLALVRSVITVFCQVGTQLGSGPIAEVGERMGISTELSKDLALAYGDAEVSALDAAVVFSTLANQGARIDPSIVLRIETDQGVVYQFEPSRQTVLEPALAAAVVRVLQDVPTAAGTARRGAIDAPSAGKTGSVETFSDAWYVGFTSDYTAAVWIGFPSASPLRNVVLNGRLYSRVFGGSAPAPMWADTMAQLADPSLSFPDEPEGTDAHFSNQR